MNNNEHFTTGKVLPFRRRGKGVLDDYGNSAGARTKFLKPSFLQLENPSTDSQGLPCSLCLPALQDHTLDIP